MRDPMIMYLEEIERKVLDVIDKNWRKYVKILADLIAVDTISTLRSSSEMMQGAQLLSSILSDVGFRIEVKAYGGHPLILAELGDGPISVLMYNHYDVQPPDPVELWSTPPFDLVEKNGKLFGRGVADNKGNIVARLAAIEALKPYLEKLGLKIKWIIEGEEEIGSPTLPKAVEDTKIWLKADGGFWETGYVDRRNRLQIALGFKGMVYTEIVVREASRDVHSGLSPLVPNPVWKLAKLLTSIRDSEGRTLVNWLYEDVEVDPESLELLKMLDSEDLEELKKMLGIEKFNADLEGFEALKALHLLPSINVSGIYAGYIGKGSKTVIPSIAGIKIDIRLVPKQNPEKILNSLKQFIERQGIKKYDLFVYGMYPAGYTKPSEDIVRASVEAAKKVYGNQPVVIPMSAGSGPFYYIANYVGTPLTGGGVGYYDSKAHAPNENIRLEDFVKGMKHVVLTMIEFIRVKQRTS